MFNARWLRYSGVLVDCRTQPSCTASINAIHQTTTSWTEVFCLCFRLIWRRSAPQVQLFSARQEAKLCLSVQPAGPAVTCGWRSGSNKSCLPPHGRCQGLLEQQGLQSMGGCCLPVHPIKSSRPGLADSSSTPTNSHGSQSNLLRGPLEVQIPWDPLTASTWTERCSKRCGTMSSICRQCVRLSGPLGSANMRSVTLDIFCSVTLPVPLS